MYIPLRQRGRSKEVAALVTFFSSGLLHEYVLALLSMKHVTGSTSTQFLAPTQYGSHVAFFVWNGLVLSMESVVRSYVQKNEKEGKKEHLMITIFQRIPQPIQTAIVLMTVLPIAHWFTDEYVANGLLPDFAMAFPRIVKL